MSDATPDRAGELPADVAWVRRLAAGLVGDRHLAEDLAQEAWLVALRRSERLAAGDGGERRAFLAGVLRRLAWKAGRGASRRTAREADADAGRAARGGGEPSADLVARAALARELVGHVLALEEPYRTALLLRYLDGLPPREIARRLDVPVRTVASRLARGRERLRDALDRRPGGRETWLGGAVALAGVDLGRSGGLLAGGILMGAKTKAAVAAGVLATVAIGVREVARIYGTEPATHRAAAAAPDGGAGDGAGELVAATAPAARSLRESEPQAAAGATPKLLVRGRATDGAAPELGIDAAPADGARVRVWLGAEPVKGSLLRRASEAEALVAAGSFELELDDPGYRPVHLRALVAGDGLHRGVDATAEIAAGSSTAELELFRAHEGVLAGIVRDDAGEPVEGVRVLGNSANKSREVAPATSDAQGRFRLVARGALLRLDVDSSELALLHATPPVRRAEGGYEDAEVTISRAGSLVIRAVDAWGAPLAGASLAVRLAREESPSPVSAGLPGYGAPPPRRADTDAAGVALVPGVWTGRKVHVAFRAGGEPAPRSANGMVVPEPEVVFDKLADGRLRRVDEEEGAALIVPPSGVLEVELRAPATLLVRGRVALPDGSAAPKPAFEIVDTGRLEWDEARRLASGAGDDGGRFEARLRAELVRGRLAVVAVDGTLANAFVSMRPIEHAARVELDPQDAQPDEASGALVLAAELVLAPTLAIAGRLVDETGEPLQQGFGNRVFAVPAGSPYPHSATALGREAMAWARNGEFRIEGLPDGVYDLYATRELEDGYFTLSTGFVRVPDVPAGTAGLELRIARSGGVRVRLRVRSDEPLQSAIVLIAAIQPRDGRAPAASTPAPIVARELASWPDGAWWDFGGAAGAITSLGREQYGFFGTGEPDGHELPDLSEGWYRFGLQPQRDANGAERAGFPIATDLVYLRRGEHEVRFELTAAAALHGRLLSDGPVAHLAVQLVDAHGRALPHPSSQGFGTKLVAHAPVSADGGFRISPAPVGRRTLRIGTPAELERGECQREVEVDVAPAGAAEPAPVQIQL